MGSYPNHGHGGQASHDRNRKWASYTAVHCGLPHNTLGERFRMPIRYIRACGREDGVLGESVEKLGQAARRFQNPSLTYIILSCMHAQMTDDGSGRKPVYAKSLSQLICNF